MFATLLTLALLSSADAAPIVLSARPAAPAKPAAPEEKEKELTAAAKKDLTALEGKWKATEILVEGKEEMPPEAEAIVEFKGRKFLLGEKELFAIANLDPSTDPKCIDFKAAADMGEIRKDTVYEGIYKIDGDTLTLALYIGDGQTRPAKFESTKDSRVVVATFKREKK